MHGNNFTRARPWTEGLVKYEPGADPILDVARPCGHTKREHLNGAYRTECEAQK